MTLLLDRPVDAMPDVPPPSPTPPAEPASTTKRRLRWPWVITAIAYVQYCVIGIWLLEVRHYAIGDALSRTATAKIMVLSRDPHLAAMGYYWMPLPTISRIPFVLITQPFGRAELAGPLSSALFAALTIPVLVAIARQLQLSTALTATIVATYALNPVTLYIAANAMSESAFGFFLALAMYGYLRWRHDGTTASLCRLGLALGGAMTCRYEMLVIAPAITVAVMLAESRAKRFHSAVLVLLPTVVVFGLWSLNSYLIMNDWLFWKRGADALTATPDGAIWLPSSLTLVNVVRHNAFMVLALAPATVVVVLGLFRFPRRWRTSIGVVGMILLLPVVLTYQTVTGTSWDVPRFFVLMPMFVTVGVMWLIRAARGHRRWSVAFSVVGVAALALGGVTATFALSDVRRTSVEGEWVFFNAVLGRPVEEQRLADESGQVVFLGDLAPFRELDRVMAPAFAADKTIALDTLIAVPFLVTEHPKQYIIPEDRDFESTMSDPIGRVDFIVRVNTDRPTGYGVMLDEVLTITEGGVWEQVAAFGEAIRLYEWVPTGEVATIPQAGAPSVQDFVN